MNYNQRSIISSIIKWCTNLPSILELLITSLDKSFFVTDAMGQDNYRYYAFIYKWCGKGFYMTSGNNHGH